ncbi:hypothetical protein BX616_008139 [Lobosporangium transversale]|uniref:Uncharacterized protein n=1 Tax=Lobosporangium transversale TaxID=64571 RepID=A0A1Y2GW18_9FUNG|nr:hypothetical protein BCR41DRAFT_393642 [Lobosporangium transversale]KAF9914508.1 hypothetical protein BX616_008139 [Lobosporangium transversale]ORZ26455.1 hypothetical protein BCR41DRAFT_393642 [Lobosporangium transversale]|eukprot:XP_021884220.1 hypothetical protein BCR41DRAFT_393642 [Lobosporangium transversale]
MPESPTLSSSASSAVIVRRANPKEDLKHVDELHRIINSAFCTDVSWTHEAHFLLDNLLSKEDAKAAIEDSTSHLLLAFDSETDQPLGTLRLSPAEAYPGSDKYKKRGDEPTKPVEAILKDQQIICGMITVDAR